LGTDVGFVCRLAGRWGSFGGGRLVVGRAGCVAQEEPEALEFFRTVPVGKKAVVANPHESAGEYVEEEPAKKLESVETHRSLSVLVRVVLVAESDLAVVEGEKPLVGDGDTVGVAGEVLEHLLRPAEGGLGVDHPVFVA
jgi:hypothetical protein